MTDAGQNSAPAIAGWNELVDGLRDLPAKMFAKLPEAQRNDPQIQQELARLALSSLTTSALTCLSGDGDHPVFTASIGQVLTNGQCNADTVYRGASLTPGGVYRISGTRGSLRMVRIAQSGPPPKKQDGTTPNLGPLRITHDVNALKADAQDRFEVILSPKRPDGYSGDWWELLPTSDKLLLRMVSCDWANERAPTLSIERLDTSVTRPRPSAGELERRLRTVPHATSFTGPMFVDHVAQLRQGGFINSFKIFDVSQMGGLDGQFYYEGAYDLKDDEALIVESDCPTQVLYRSLILTNDIYETTDWYNNHSSLNDAQAPADPDGKLRIVVSAKDPGVPNWLDTAGYATGVIQGRWTECDSQPIPSARKVAVGDVRKYLHPDTPSVTLEQREKIIRTRRAALHQRPLW